MRNPYRIIVWGPGGLGLISIWEILQSPAFELVGVRAYGDAKNGKDVGELMGLPPTGILASTDVESLLALDCDCIIYTARDAGNFNTDEELLGLLSAGKNVVTPLPYQNAHLWRDEEFVRSLEQACQKGGSVFHATGIDPDVVSDRVLIGLTGMCTDISSLKLQENWEADAVAGEILSMVGFGKPPEEVRENPVAIGVAVTFVKAMGYTVGDTLGVIFDRVELTHDFITSETDFQSRNIFIKAGTVGRVTHRFSGYVKDKGPGPFFTMEVNWIIGHQMLPPGVLPNQYWVATIEGRPSLKMVIDLKASLKNDDRFYTIGNMQTEPGYHATVAPCLQAIPVICSSPPGVIHSFGPRTRWMPDFRNIEQQA